MRGKEMAESFTREFTFQGNQCLNGADILKAAAELGSHGVVLKPKSGQGENFDPHAVYDGGIAVSENSVAAQLLADRLAQLKF